MTSEVKLTELRWVRKGQPASEPVETGMRFVKLSACPSHHILFLPFTGCPHQAYFSPGITQAAFMKTTELRHG